MIQDMVVGYIILIYLVGLMIQYMVLGYIILKYLVDDTRHGASIHNTDIFSWFDDTRHGTRDHLGIHNTGNLVAKWSDLDQGDLNFSITK